MSNVDVIRSVYAAFGRQDVPAILEHLSDDVEWEYAYPDRGVPWLAPRRGRAGVVAFFQSLTAVDMTQFDVKTILSGDNLVLALVDVAMTVRATGKPIVEVDEGHLWTFDARGKIARFRHFVDTVKHHEACKA
jgi:uncharacterized protein